MSENFQNNENLPQGINLPSEVAPQGGKPLSGVDLPSGGGASREGDLPSGGKSSLGDGLKSGRDISDGGHILVEDKLSYSELLGNKKRRKSLLIRVGIISGAVVIAIILLLFGLRFFMRVESVEIFGNAIYSDEAIAEISGIKIGQTLDSVSAGKIKKALTANFDFVDDVTIKKSPLGVVSITIIENNATFFIPISDRYIIVSEGLYVISIIKQIPTSFARYGNIREVRIDTIMMPIKSAIEGEKLVFENEKDAQRLTYIINNIEYSDLLRENVHIVDANFYELTMIFDGRIEISYGTASNLADKIAFSEQILIDINDNGHGQLFVYNTEDSVLYLETPSDYSKYVP